MPDLVLGPLLRHVGETDATVWVETAQPCTVEVLEHKEHTWTAGGHHYALLVIEGLEPGSDSEYEVRLDGELVWPEPDATHPSVIRTLRGDGSLALAFGSCRFATTSTAEDPHLGIDALENYAKRMRRQPTAQWPDALLLLGDQIYADELSAPMRDRIAQHHDLDEPPGAQVRNFEEYTWLYAESWCEPDVRWLLSTVPTSMIFDDHDVRDDWNTSASWRDEQEASDWWEERIVGALASYWIYQHLGNLAPADLAANELYQRVRTHDGDVGTLLRRFASEADEEADGAKGARWSYRRDLGPARLLVIDSRCGRVLADGRRSMVSEPEFDWIVQQTEGDYDHLLVGTSLPWLLPRALHDVESWDERLASGARGARPARWAEKLRRAADLEHWAAFRDSFDRLARLFGEVGGGHRTGERGRPPATICVLSGDVHHAYVAEATYAHPMTSRVYQLTCSPLHNFVPSAMKVAFRISWSRAAERATRFLLGRVSKVPPMIIDWHASSGPYFGNQVGTLRLAGRSAQVTFERARPSGSTEFDTVAAMSLAAEGD
ncbi:alkaline phosphatase family protein [Aldersonia sp. NBC_00410]|uniref:alkaline phosphatase D family protein n=1 Tax=Aldersonia sp. NBC_00410 TaxID=2975954 RepID=UPI002254E304|nr:alkaline phosphatase D family protein [Aldersonia sp. NBC_00410]MCX5046575.1 alkaline phosphatase family protein [Aldersonia sp. NBC_00410]